MGAPCVKAQPSAMVRQGSSAVIGQVADRGDDLAHPLLLRSRAGSEMSVASPTIAQRSRPVYAIEAIGVCTSVASLRLGAVHRGRGYRR